MNPFPTLVILYTQFSRNIWILFVGVSRLEFRLDVLHSYGVEARCGVQL